jgi:type IV pilus assembly protein PilA
MTPDGALKSLRRRAGGEAGFTMVELLVVMLILGILAAIALVTFLNQREKAEDSQAKTNARTLMTAMEVCGSDNGGAYGPCDITALRAVEGAIPQAGNTVHAAPNADSWSVTADSTGGNSFTIERDSDGSLERTCTVPNGNDRGGCPPGGHW